MRLEREFEASSQMKKKPWLYLASIWEPEMVGSGGLTKLELTI